MTLTTVTAVDFSKLNYWGTVFVVDSAGLQTL